MAEPSATVYSWYMPEIAALIERDARTRYPTALFKQNYEPGLDTVHELLVDRYRLSSAHTVIDSGRWDLVPHRYYTNGSSEGLFHLLARHKAVHPTVPLYQFEGEYQGYSEYARTLGLQFIDVLHGQDVNRLRPGVFFVSAPSAIDGNVIANSAIETICERHYVVLDIAYAGMTPVRDLIKLNGRIAAVVGSMSKPFGLYYYRIGFLWARDPVPSLYGNKWFKNIFSIKTGERVLHEYDAQWLADRYRPWQTRACNQASGQYGIEIVPSDVWLLGHVLPSTTGVPPGLEKFKRGPGYRLCLTPYFMEYASAL